MPVNYDFVLDSVPLSIADSLLSGRPVTDGDPVNAAVTNRLPQTNAANTAYIHSLIKQFRDLSGEYLWRMPIANDVRIGDFVYLDIHAREFKRGLAKFTAIGGDLHESDTSIVWGVVTDIADDKADICTNGLCSFTPTSGAYTVDSQPGIRFLSDTVPGGTTEEVKYPTKCVGYLVGVQQSGKVQFFVRPYLSVDTGIHRHRSYALDVAAGWLPASDPVFDGNAPVDAVYGYDPALLAGCGWP